MAKQSPLQRVRDEHGSKEDLADKVIGVLDKPEEEPSEHFEHRIHTLSNRKLLRLWNTHEIVEDKWGSKDALVDAITNARFSGGNEDYANKLQGYALTRLVDLARQHGLHK